jgi:RNA polymerase subunit RPABC4/transcription elongation factor Spt4
LLIWKSLGGWNYDASKLSEKINQVNSHENARLIIEVRKLLMERIYVIVPMRTAKAAGISHQTARKICGNCTSRDHTRQWMSGVWLVATRSEGEATRAGQGAQDITGVW